MNSLNWDSLLESPIQDNSMQNQQGNLSKQVTCPSTAYEFLQWWIDPVSFGRLR
jgi:hypothetical protein